MQDLVSQDKEFGFGKQGESMTDEQGRPGHSLLDGMNTRKE